MLNKLLLLLSVVVYGNFLYWELPDGSAAPHFYLTKEIKKLERMSAVEINVSPVESYHRTTFSVRCRPLDLLLGYFFFLVYFTCKQCQFSLEYFTLERSYHFLRLEVLRSQSHPPG